MARGIGGVRIQLFPARIGALINSPAGPVSFATRTAAERVEKKARTLIGTKYSGYARIRREKRGETNHKELAKSGKVERAAGSSWRVSFINDHALPHHEGHKKPFIRARAGKFLVFQAREGGQVFAKQVRGFKGNPYLVNAARKLGVVVSRHNGPLTQNSVLLGKLGGSFFKRIR